MNRKGVKLNDGMRQVLRRVGWRLNRLRVRRWLSQKQLAEKTKIKQTTISYIERGVGHTSLANIIKLADFFAVPLGEILEDERLEARFFEERDLIKNSSVSEVFRDLPPGIKVEKRKLNRREIIAFKVDEHKQLGLHVTAGELVVKGMTVFEILKPGQAVTVYGPAEFRVINHLGKSRGEVLILNSNKPTGIGQILR